MPPKGKKKAKAYGLADINAEGITVRDLFKKEWRVDHAIATGGFGRLYQATRLSDPDSKTSSNYVIKIEPFDNGPLFSELSFYQRAAKPAPIESYMREHKLKKLGMPMYISSGIHEVASDKYRFMIIPKYKVDLQTLFDQSGRRFPTKTVLNILLQVLDVLQYLQSNDYVHADIKAGNLLIGDKDPHQVYLVDYGLAYRYRDSEKKHKAYKEDPKKCHDGTLEYTSRDAHKGCCPSRRGDLEILGYCCLEWIMSYLPWHKHLSQPDKVSQMKHQLMENPSSALKGLSKDIPSCLLSYINEVSKLDYEDEPNYDGLKKLVKDGMKKDKMASDGKLDFPRQNQPSPSKKRVSKDDKTPRKKAKVDTLSAGDTDAESSGAKQKTKVVKKKQAAPKEPQKKTTPRGKKVAYANSAALKHAISPMSAAAIKRDKALALKKSPAGSSRSSKSSKISKPQTDTGTQTTPSLKGTKSMAKPKKKAVKK